MAMDLQATDLKGRIQRVEDWVKTLRWLVGIATILLGAEIWLMIHPSLFQAGAVRARKFTVVDSGGKTIAELGADSTGSHLSFYDANSKPQAQITVSEGEGPKILLFDKNEHQRVLLEVADAPHLVLHSSDQQMRALLAADDDTTTFWIKDRKGFVTILGNAVEESRRIDRSSGRPVVKDTVKKTPGASIELRDPGNSTLWKAP